MTYPEPPLSRLTTKEIKFLQKIKEVLGSEGSKGIAYRTWAGRLGEPDTTTRNLLRRFEALGAIKIDSPPKKGPKPCLYTWLARGDEILGQASESQAIENSKGANQVRKIDLLTGVVPPDSNLYVEREADKTSMEALQTVNNCRTILPFIRIKGAKGMGKSSLLMRLRHRLKTDKAQVVGFVDLAGDSFEPEAFTNLNKLLYRFTQAINQTFSKLVSSLNLPPLKEYWEEDLAPGLNCSNYIRLIFSHIKKPKTLFIDGIDKVLESEKLRSPFCNVLRSWCVEEMTLVSESPLIWPSVVIAYSTDKYAENGILVSSLYNVGIELELKEFTFPQMEELIEKYGLHLSQDEVKVLYKLVGGHPTLTNQSLYFLNQEGKNLSKLESQATLVNGPFGNHLLHHLELLQKKPELRQCFSKIMNGEKYDNEFVKYQLEKAGLIKIDDTMVTVRFELYKKYFQEHLE
jgi:hypothetical protein